MKKMTDRDWVALAVDLAEAIAALEEPDIDFFHDEYGIATFLGQDYLGDHENAVLRCRNFDFYLREYLDEGRGRSPEELIAEQIGFTPTEDNPGGFEDETEALLGTLVPPILYDFQAYGEDPYGVGNELDTIIYELQDKYDVLFEFDGFGAFKISVWDEEELKLEEEGSEEHETE